MVSYLIPPQLLVKQTTLFLSNLEGIWEVLCNEVPGGVQMYLDSGSLKIQEVGGGRLLSSCAPCLLGSLAHEVDAGVNEGQGKEKAAW